MPSDALEEFAPAKVNLTLRVLGRRSDGYHELESLVAFADVGDHVRLLPGAPLGLDVTGSTAALAGPGVDNLVLKAARALSERAPGLRLGRFELRKELPVAAGLGGGSSDAAAALRLVARLNGLEIDDARLRAAALATGADVPVCLDPRARMMRGIGERLSRPLDLAPLAAVLVNPGVAVATRDVFAALDAPALVAAPRPSSAPAGADLAAFIAREPNDLQRPALMLQPLIGAALDGLRAASGCRLARMSGSGATCFGLFADAEAAAAAAAALRRAHSAWWVSPALLR